MTQAAWGEWRSCLHERPLQHARVLRCYEAFEASERERARMYLANALSIELHEDILEQLWAYHRAPVRAMPAGTLRLQLAAHGMRVTTQGCIDWAIDAMLRGLDGQDLRLLAGMSREDRAIDALALFGRASRALELETFSHDAMVLGHIDEIVDDLLCGERTPAATARYIEFELLGALEVPAQANCWWDVGIDSSYYLYGDSHEAELHRLAEVVRMARDWRLERLGVS